MMKDKSFKSLSCKCGTSVKVDAGTSAVTCHMCVSKMVGFPTKPKKMDDSARATWRKIVAEKKAMQAARKKQFEGFPRGWHLKAQYTAKDGRMFQKGKEVKAFTTVPKVVKEKSGMPRGWHLRRSFSFNGVEYSFGKVVEKA